MVKRILALLLALLMITGCGYADELDLRDSTPAQKTLKTYMEKVNELLVENGELEINKVFDQTDYTADLGVVSLPDAYDPEHVSVTVYMKYDGIHYLLLRVDDVYRFPKIAGAFIRALNPEKMTWEQAMETPTQRAQKAISNPHDSYTDYEYNKYADRDTEILNGEQPQISYAYKPDQPIDKKSWLEMMIIFPMPEYWDQQEGVITKVETTDPPFDEEGEGGYFAENRLVVMETYSTPTPEPDSAAMEYDVWAPDD